MSANYKHKIIDGLTTMTFSSLFVFILQLLTTLILARIFTPLEFGMINAVLIVVSYTDIFSKIGIGPAIVQKKDLSNEDINTGFTSSLVLGIFFTLIIIIFSSKISKFINLENQKVLNLISLSLTINSFGVMPLSLLQRNLKFSLILKKDIVGSLIYSISAICLGLFGFKTYGLGIALLLKYLASTFILLKGCKTKFKIDFNLHSFKRMINFGMGYSISQLLSVTTNQADYLVVARTLGTFSLGIYSKAYQLMSIPASLLGQAIDIVLFPIMSNLQDENDKIEEIFIIFTLICACIFFPISGMFFIFSSQIITLALGTNWIDSSVPFGILSLGIFFRVGYKICDPLFRAKGIVYNRALIHLLHAIITIIGALIGVRWGIVGVAISICITLIINYLIVIYVSYKLIKFNASIIMKTLFINMILNALVIMLVKSVEHRLVRYNSQIVSTMLMLLYIILTLVVFLFIYFIVFPKDFRIKVMIIIRYLKDKVIRRATICEK